MKSILTLTCLLCLGLAGVAAAQEARPETITITKKALPAGTVASAGKTGKMDMAQTMTLGGNVVQDVKMKATMSDKRRWTVLATDDKGVSKLKLQVVEDVETMEAEGLPEGADAGQNEEGPLSGKAFVITRSESDLKIEPDGDFEVTADMEMAIKRDLHDSTGSLVSGTAGLDKLVDKGKFTVGSTTTLSRQDLNNFMGSERKEFPVESMSFKATGSRIVLGVDCAVFDVVAKIAPEQGADGETSGPPMTADLTGEAVIRKDGGWLQGLELRGPLNMEVNREHEGMTIETVATGNIELKLLVIFAVTKK